MTASSLRALRAKYAGQTATHHQIQAEPLTDEERKRRQEEATQKAIRVELQTYMLESPIDEDDDIPFQDVLSYWKV